MSTDEEAKDPGEKLAHNEDTIIPLLQAEKEEDIAKLRAEKVARALATARAWRLEWEQRQAMKPHDFEIQGDRILLHEDRSSASEK